MSHLQEFIITLHNHEDLDSFYQDMETEFGSDIIPNRKVEVVNRRPISRNTHYLLTYEEAEKLQSDPRVRYVDIPKQNVHQWTQSGTFNFGVPIASTDLNWGKYFLATDETSIDKLLLSPTFKYNTTISRKLSGRNVDVINKEGNFDPTHPEFAVKADGSGGSRLQQVNWLGYGLPNYLGSTTFKYDFSVKGTHATSTSSLAVGNKYGFATDAFLYGTGSGGVQGGQVNTQYDYYRLFHINKTVNPNLGRRNPTLIHSSASITPNLIHINELNVNAPGNTAATIIRQGVNYTGPWTYTGPITAGMSGARNPVNWTNSTQKSLQDAGITHIGFFTTPSSNAKDAYIWSWASDEVEQADISDCVRDGITVVEAAGNNNAFFVDSSHPDFDNRFTIIKNNLTRTFYLHRHPAYNPINGTNRQLIIGNLNPSPINDNGAIKVGRASDSNYGKIDWWVPGNGTLAACEPRAYDSTSIKPDIRNSKYFIDLFSGTSAACPMAAGVIACIMELAPTFTQAQLVSYLRTHEKTNRVKHSSTDTVSGTQSLYFPDHTFNITVNKTTAIPGEKITYTITTTNVPNGAILYLTQSGSAPKTFFVDNNDRFAVTVTNNRATLERTLNKPINNNQSSFTTSIEVRTGGYNGTLQTASNATTITIPVRFASLPSSINEGSTGNFVVNTSGIADNTTLYWTINYITTNANDFTAPNGSFKINKNQGTFTVNVRADLLSEGIESFTVSIRETSITGTVVAISNPVIINDTSRAPTYNFSSIPTNIDEGASGTFTVTTTDVANKTVLHWRINHISTVASDFSVADGTISISNNQASFTITPKKDTLRENSEEFSVILSLTKNGSALTTSRAVRVNNK
jgi:hypothetical protein